MRRSDRNESPGWGQKLRLLTRAAALPPPVYRDFVDMLFGMRLPIFGLGVVFVGIAVLIAFGWRDSIAAALALAGALVTVARVLLIGAYRRARATADIEQLRRWEWRYALGNYAFAVLIALLNIQALTYHQPLMHLLTVSLVFSFGAGVVSRISVRPVICAASLLMATVPTVVAIVAHALIPHAAPLHAQLFALEAALIAMITALSLQTVVHLHRTAVVHYTARHDMAQMARHDALTGLANRLSLRERFLVSSLDAARTGSRLALHFVDLDGFKAINDTHGHPAGDAVLRQVADRLTMMVRAGDTVARLGGDEFVVLQAEVGQPGEAELLGRRIIKQLSAPYEVDGKQMQIAASTGIAMTPDYGPDLEQLLGCADAALYRSKLAGKGRLSFCTREDAAKAQAA